MLVIKYLFYISNFNFIKTFEKVSKSKIKHSTYNCNHLILLKVQTVILDKFVNRFNFGLPDGK